MLFLCVFNGSNPTGSLSPTGEVVAPASQGRPPDDRFSNLRARSSFTTCTTVFFYRLYGQVGDWLSFTGYPHAFLLRLYKQVGDWLSFTGYPHAFLHRLYKQVGDSRKFTINKPIPPLGDVKSPSSEKQVYILWSDLAFLHVKLRRSNCFKRRILQTIR